jgi:hypothetical protein
MQDVGPRIDARLPPCPAAESLADDLVVVFIVHRVK